MTEPPLKLENYMAVATKVPLLPCPFCGEQVALTNVRMSGHSFAIGCYNESCWRPRTDYYDSEEAVTEAWNTRPRNLSGPRQRAENPSVIAEIQSYELGTLTNGASDSSSLSTLTALQGSLSEMVTNWRAMAKSGQEDIIPGDECAIARWTMAEMLADELEAALAVVRVPQRQEETEK